METLKIKFEHCNGISKLEQEFKFSNRNFAIYAPNGTMKTSFAKTFNEYAKGLDSKDHVFVDNLTTRDIWVDGRNQLDKESILVIEPYNESYKSDKITTLLANKELKNQYDELHKNINEAQIDLIKKFKKLSGITKDTVILDDIKRISGKSFIEVIAEIDFSKIKFNTELSKYRISDVLNDKSKAFLVDNSSELNSYVSEYNDLLTKSKYLKKEFNFYNIETINKQLETNNFFKVGHSIQLSDGSNNTNLKTSKELEALCAEEKKKISEDPKLLEKFNAINKKLDANNELRDLRKLLLEHPEIITELNDINKFEKSIWYAYFYQEKDLLEKLSNEYHEAQEQIKSIISIANQQKTAWEEAIEIFNDKFIYLPYSLSISNKSDSILKENVPVLEFEFKNNGKIRKYKENQKDELLKILSTGEKRALYILNVVFEVEARKRLHSDSLLIIDDIADSFDYKNKYAIIDYLKHISELNNFYMLILTHNFDFYRTIQSRNITPYSQCLMALKDPTGLISLTRAKYLKNPFKTLKENINSNIILVSLIPFVRNLIEYIYGEDSEDYLMLTSLLHYKSDTCSITLECLQSVFNKVNITIPSDYDFTKKMIEVIEAAAQEAMNSTDVINLEAKLVLSIAIRLKSELFMFNKIEDEQFKSDLSSSKNQTWQLVKKFSETFNNENDVLKIINRVSLITPENIHINSFMYEPILDMGDVELKNLYVEVNQIESKLIQ